MKKKGIFSLIAVIMAAFLVVGMVPTSVLAGNDETPEEIAEEISEESEVNFFSEVDVPEGDDEDEVIVEDNFDEAAPEDAEETEETDLDNYEEVPEEDEPDPEIETYGVYDEVMSGFRVGYRPSNYDFKFEKLGSRNEDGSNTYDIMFFCDGDEEWIDENITFEVEDVTSEGQLSVMEDAGIAYSEPVTTITSADPYLNEMHRYNYYPRIDIPYAAGYEGVFGPVATSGKEIIIDAGMGTRYLKVTAYMGSEVVDYTYVISNGKMSDEKTESEKDKELFERACALIEEQIWTDDMSNLEKLNAFASYINSVSHYPDYPTTTYEYNPEWANRWGVDGSTSYHLIWWNFEDQYYDWTLALEGGQATCLAAYILEYVAENHLGLQEIDYDDTSAGEGVCIATGSKSSNPTESGHYSLIYQASDGTRTFVDAQGMTYSATSSRVTCSAHGCMEKIIHLTPSAIEPEPVEIDKTELQAEYDEDKDLTESDYTEASWSAFKTALDNAEAVLNDDEATQEQVDAALDALKAAKDALVEVDEEPEPEVVDKEALQKEYNDDKDLAESDYTEESWSAFKTALDNAEAVLNDNEATQDVVDAALDALKTAKEALQLADQDVPVPDEVDKTELLAEYEADANLKESDYTEESWSAFKTALDNADVVLNDEEATQEQVDAALDALKTAKDALVEVGEGPEPETVDKTALQEEYDADKDLAESEYTEESWNAFKTALDNAEAVLKDDEATQDQVDAALEALKTAKDALVKDGDKSEPGDVDKEALQKEYDEDKDLPDKNYTEESWNAFKTALENAEAVLNDSEATQAQVDAALEALKTAKDALKTEGEDTEPPVPIPEPDNTRNISGSKTWNDDNDKADARPDSITVNLYQNEKLYVSEDVTADDDWSWSWTVPENDENGNAYIYTIKEEDVKYYIVSYEKNGNFDITNTFVGEEGAVTGSGSGSGEGGDVPKTGDTNNFGIWLALLIVGAAAAVAGFAIKRRQS